MRATLSLGIGSNAAFDALVDGAAEGLKEGSNDLSHCYH